MSGRRRVVRQFAWVSGGRVVAAVLQALVLALVARSVTPAEFGVLGIFLGLAAVAQTAVDMGVGTFIIRERAARPDSGEIAVAMRFNNYSSSLLSVLCAIALVLLGALVSPIWWFLLPLAVWIGAERNADARISIALADGDAKINVTNLVGRRLLAVLILLVLVGVGLDGLLAYAVALAIAALISSIYANGYVRRRVAPASSSSYRAVLARSRAFWIHSLATQARNLDVPIVGSVAGATAAGYYSAGSRLTNPLRILPYSLASVLLPEATRAFRAGRSLKPSLGLAGIMVAGVSLLYVVLIPLTPWLVDVVLGVAYSGSVVVIQIVLAGMPFAAGVSLAHALLQALGRKSLVAASSTMFTASTLVAVFLAAVVAGAVGAAIALSAATAVQCLYLVAWLAVSIWHPRPPEPEEEEPETEVEE